VVEVKYFEKNKGRFNWPFYAGLDEAIASLNYGVDSSALWQVFSPDTEERDLRQIGAALWTHVSELNLPVEFTIMVDRFSDFDVYGQRHGTDIVPRFVNKLSTIPVLFACPNPIKEKPTQVKLRALLYRSWKTQDRRSGSL
jgi:hypothetical protein